LDPEVAYFIELHLLCSTYHVLPGPGGVLDQDSYIMYGLMGAISAFAEKAKMEQRQQESKLTQARAKAGR